MLDNLEQILSRIQQAETDAMVSICITSSCINCLCTFVQYVMVTPTLLWTHSWSAQCTFSNLTSHVIALMHAYSTILAVSSVFQVMESYTGGLKAMKAALQAQPLSKEELEDVMDQLQDMSVCARVCMLSQF